MHSHNRTLLASLGFADKDKKLPAHDRACQYIMQRPVADTIAELCGCPFTSYGDEPPELDSTTAKTEIMISKGEGKYRSTIGFVDVIIKAKWLIPTLFNHKCGDEVRQWEWSWKNRDQSKDFIKPIAYTATILCEIKIDPVPIGDIIRQLALYRSFVDCHSAVLVAGFDLRSIDGDTLDAADLKIVRLGRRFREFCKSSECNTTLTIAEV